MRSSQDRAIDYIEFPCTDTNRVKAFYTAVFGWTFVDYGPDYTSFEDGRTAGGFTKAAKVAGPSGPLVVFYARDLAAAEARVEAAGGTIVQPTFSFPGGRRFHFADPEGNILAIWSKSEA